MSSESGPLNHILTFGSNSELIYSIYSSADSQQSGDVIHAVRSGWIHRVCFGIWAECYWQGRQRRNGAHYVKQLNRGCKIKGVWSVISFIMYYGSVT